MTKLKAIAIAALVTLTVVSAGVGLRAHLGEAEPARALAGVEELALLPVADAAASDTQQSVTRTSMRDDDDHDREEGKRRTSGRDHDHDDDEDDD